MIKSGFFIFSYPLLPTSFLSEKNFDFFVTCFSIWKRVTEEIEVFLFIVLLACATHFLQMSTFSQCFLFQEMIHISFGNNGEFDQMILSFQIHAN